MNAMLALIRLKTILIFEYFVIYNFVKDDIFVVVFYLVKIK
jgi:hypothetical protein